VADGPQLFDELRRRGDLGAVDDVEVDLGLAVRGLHGLEQAVLLLRADPVPAVGARPVAGVQGDGVEAVALDAADEELDGRRLARATFPGEEKAGVAERAAGTGIGFTADPAD